VAAWVVWATPTLTVGLGLVALKLQILMARLGERHQLDVARGVIERSLNRPGNTPEHDAEMRARLEALDKISADAEFERLAQLLGDGDGLFRRSPSRKARQATEPSIP
jgi:hypothetical protein